MRTPLLAFAVAFAVVVCESCKDHEIVASDYDQSCTQDSDCVAITVGDAICVSHCPNAAINESSESQYESDVNAGKQDCPSTASTGSPYIPCGTYSILCRRNVCFLGAPYPDAGADAGSDADSDAD